LYIKCILLQYTQKDRGAKFISNRKKPLARRDERAFRRSHFVGKRRSGWAAGKYFAACTVLLCTVGASLIYPLIVAIFGTLYLEETMVGYLGLILQGCSFLALDLFISCFAQNQMTAVVLGIGVNLSVWLSDVVAAAVSVEFFSSALEFFSLYQRFVPFAQGQLSFSNVLFNLLFIFIMLFLSVRVLDARRWSEA